MQWAVSADFFDADIAPRQRTQRLLSEIQKRSLAEQVIVTSWDRIEQTEKILYTCPFAETPALNHHIRPMLLKKGSEENKVLFVEDFWSDPNLRSLINRSSIHSILFSPLNISSKSIDALLIINYSLVGDQERIEEFVRFVSSILALSVNNAELSDTLHQKNEEITEWTGNVEKRIEEGTKKILENEFHYYALFEGANEAILVHHMDGAVIEANQMACKLLGFSKNEFVKGTFYELVPGDEREKIAQYIEQVINKQKVQPLEIEISGKDNQSFPAEISSRRVKFRGENVLQSSIRDVSARKAVEERLRESKERYQLLVESSLVGAFIIQNGKVLFANDKFGELTGRAKERLLDKNFYELVGPEDRGMVKNREDQREKNMDVPEQYEAQFLRNEEETWWAELRCRRIEVDDKTAVLGNVLDITPRKRLEMQLLESQKMESIGTLAGGIAHDFNNLLGGILGYASLLMSELDKDHPYYDDIRAIAETAKRAADLTNRLLAFARGGKYQVTTLNLNRILNDVVSLLTHTPAQAVIIEKHFVKNLWPISGDMQQVHQAFMNICLNSMEAMRGGGTLEVSTANVILDESFAQTQLGVKPGDFVRVKITDTGVGMDLTTKARIFEPFFTTKPSQDGKGLGMSMVYGIIKNHDGTILVDSDLGAGTRVTIYLPRAPQKELQSEDQTGKESKAKTVLLVDDEEVIRKVGKRMLERYGYHVIVAKEGREAIDLYSEKANEIDVIILDLIMPELGGKETYAQLRAINKDVPVIFTSGYGPHDHPDLAASESTAFIQKPFQTEKLIEVIQNQF